MVRSSSLGAGFNPRTESARTCVGEIPAFAGMT